MAGDTPKRGRRSVHRYETEAVQGEGSWVEVKRMTLGESKAVQHKSQKLAAKVAKMKAAAVAAGDDEALLAAGIYEQNEGWKAGLEMFATKVVGWNWLDDDGNPLPLPRENPDVLDELTDEEIALISELIVGDVEARKKRLSGFA